MYNERVFIRTMIDCATPKTPYQMGSGFSIIYFSTIGHLFDRIVCEPTLSVTVDRFEYRSLYLLSIAHGVFSFDIYIPHFQKNLFEIFFLSFYCCCKHEEKATQKHTNTYRVLYYSLMFKVQAVHHLLGNIIGGFVRQINN